MYVVLAGARAVVARGAAHALRHDDRVHGRLGLVLEALAQAVEKLRKAVLSRDRASFTELMEKGRDYLEDRRSITAQRA